MKWYRLAAEQGYTVAQSNLGWMYRKGKGVPQDYKTTVKWYRLAAEQGVCLNAQSQSGLDVRQRKRCSTGYGKTAAKFYRLAAEQGDADAQSQSGCDVTGTGKGVTTRL